ncbi:MAG: AmmeMemoRadiSam system protein A [Anaerolineaceae bacterium]|nr:AmmeMemoRadiSam system protein A [Anaerolineaceae bacterium]
MTTNLLTPEERSYLLKLARDSITNAVRHKPSPHISLETLSPSLAEPGASFVTLTIDGDLRGCIGSLEAHQSLAEDVRERAAQAALEDYRFPPLAKEEIDHVKIEISRLTKPEPLIYEKPEDLPRLLKPNVDGVILQQGFRRATFLPQVWQQLPDPQDFLSHLCAKMGAPHDLWRKTILQVMIYHVEEFHE